jgi:hypothetical protein
LNPDPDPGSKSRLSENQRDARLRIAEAQSQVFLIINRLCIHPLDPGPPHPGLWSDISGRHSGSSAIGIMAVTEARVGFLNDERKNAGSHIPLGRQIYQQTAQQPRLTHCTLHTNEGRLIHSTQSTCIPSRDTYKETGDTARLPAQLAGRWGRLEQPKQEKNILYRHDEPNELGNQGRTPLICTP